MTLDQAPAAGEPHVVVDAKQNVAASVEFAWPAAGPVSSFMNDEHPQGIDVGLAQDPNGRIAASADGKVIYVGGMVCCSYGYHVILDHGGGLTTLYAHLSEILVREGEEVNRGDLLGYGGTTGRSTSEHLHFEVRRDDIPLDPLSQLPWDHDLN